ncbi:hypothetical protein VTK73DRAFT_10059 [Phialemonium thermophilum]|uniref:Uncharacterized protein n=1 Tax=Phialemonium thermophilum TaxID=223376 RepID=A0ABR3VZ82_9PEZI
MVVGMGGSLSYALASRAGWTTEATHEREGNVHAPNSLKKLQLAVLSSGPRMAETRAIWCRSRPRISVESAPSILAPRQSTP